MQLLLQNQRITALEAEVERLRPKRRRKIPNPNRKFMDLVEILESQQQATNKAKIPHIIKEESLESEDS